MAHSVQDDENEITISEQFNRFEEDRLDQLAFHDEEMLTYAGEELTEDEVEQNTAAEIALYEMRGRASSFGFVARHVSSMIENGVHTPVGETAEGEPVLSILVPSFGA